MKKGNLYAFKSENSAEEVFDTLFENDKLKVERIISTGQATPKDEWYDQEQEEWVILLAGSAGLQFESDDNIQTMLNPGDFIHIPAHSRHRVEWTDNYTPTLWLVCHF